MTDALGQEAPPSRCLAARTGHAAEPGGTVTAARALLVVLDETLDFHTWHVFTEALSWKNNSAAYSKHSFLPGRGGSWCRSKLEDHRYNLLKLKQVFIFYFYEVLRCLF